MVDKESPPGVMPFARAAGHPAGAGPRKVFVHYFPFFQISFDDAPVGHDTWSVSFLSRDGEGGKWRDVGGMVRERPLPAAPLPSGVWPQPYWREINIAVDVLRARAMGADGFGLDLVSTASGPNFEAAAWSQAQRVCRTAAEVAPGFEIMIEPDAAILAKASAQEIADTVRELAKCPAAARSPDHHLLLTPFAPETRGPAFWAEVIADLHKAGVAVAFIPDFVDPAAPTAKPIAAMSDGLTEWGARDPAWIASPPRHTQTRVWMQPIAPQDERPKVAAFWETDNTEMFRASWAEAFHQDANYIHLITWNDYGEATEVAPSTGTQFLFYDLSRYFIDWYKAGEPPRIMRDAIYYSQRTQIFDPAKPPRPTDKPFKHWGPSPVRNRVELVALLTAPAALEIEIGPHRKRLPFGAGLVAMTMEAQPGRPVFRIIRGSKVVVEKVSDWTIDPSPSAANPVYFGGSSTRPFVTAP